MLLELKSQELDRTDISIVKSLVINYFKLSLSEDSLILPPYCNIMNYSLENLKKITNCEDFTYLFMKNTMV